MAEEIRTVSSANALFLNNILLIVFLAYSLSLNRFLNQLINYNFSIKLPKQILIDILI